MQAFIDRFHLKAYFMSTMNNLNEETLAQISRLVKIDIPLEDRPGIVADLERILDYAHMLDDVDTKETHACYHVLEDVKCPLRPDVVTSTFKTEDLLENAPDKTGGMVKIPPLMES